jgi:hypothetical protein
MKQSRVVWMGLLLVASLALAAGVWAWMARPVFATDVDVILSEVMFNTACGAYGASGVCSDGADETQFEWIEIYNAGTTGVDLSGWHVCDETQACSALSGTIPAGEYWVIAHNNDAPNYDLQSEFDHYTATVDAAKTIFLNGPIAGDGLVDGDAVYLKTAGSTCGPGSSLPCVSDCVSWDTVNTCANLVDDVALAYLPGADGFDSTALTSGEGEGQSIVNIQGTWYQAGPLSGQDNQASPYAGNVAEGGTPTAILFSSLRSGAGGPVLVVAVGGAMVAALALRRRRAR